MTEATLDIASARAQFPALSRTHNDQAVVFFDGPAGSQVPRRVAEAVSRYLLHSNANTHGVFETSLESDEILQSARNAVAAFLGVESAESIVFGQNMTSLGFALSRSLAREWGRGDEIVVTRLDHDANVSPWVLAARDAGATIRKVPIAGDTCAIDMDALRDAITDRTVLVAVGAASNATGAVNPVAEIASLAHAVGAELFVDAVHYAPHRLIDVPAFGCDYLACSAYKFFGPHVGILWGRPDRMAALPAYQVRPAGDALPGRWQTGTQNHEGIAGTREAIEYIADLVTPRSGDLRAALRASYGAIRAHEDRLAARLLQGLGGLDHVTVWGPPDLSGQDRVPTVSITVRNLPSERVAQILASRGIYVWHGNYYALELTESLQLEPDGMVRIGLLHYNTEAEVELLLDALRALV